MITMMTSDRDGMFRVKSFSRYDKVVITFERPTGEVLTTWELTTGEALTFANLITDVAEGGR